MPESALSQIARPLRDQYQKGLSAFQQRNYDYAIQILMPVLEQEPGFFACRQTLRAAQVAQSRKSSSGFFKKLLLGASSSPLIAKGQLSLRSNPQEALNVAEQILTSDPSSMAGHKILAEAARALDLPKTSQLSLEILSKNLPNDQDIQRQLGQCYSELGLGEKAEAIYANLIAANPDDVDLREEYKNISARSVLDQNGYQAIAQGSGSYRDILKDSEQAVALEQENRQVKTEDATSQLIRQYETQLNQQPGDLRLMRTIAELYSQKHDFDRALEYYDAIGKTAGFVDAALRKSIANTVLTKFDFQLSQLDPQAPVAARRRYHVRARPWPDVDLRLGTQDQLLRRRPVVRRRRRGSSSQELAQRRQRRLQVLLAGRQDGRHVGERPWLAVALADIVESVTQHVLGEARGLCRERRQNVGRSFGDWAREGR